MSIRFFNDREKVSLPLLTDKDVVSEAYGDGYILAFFIPRATRDTVSLSVSDAGH